MVPRTKVGSWPQPYRFKSWLCHLLAVALAKLIFLYISFLIYKMELIIK